MSGIAISASAKIRAGTRMSSREELGISHVVSSIRCRSDIENDAPAPDPVLRSEAKTVERHGLDERSRLADVTAERCADLGARERELRSLGDESLGLGEEDELVEPRHEQTGEVTRGNDDLPLARVARAVRCELGECVQRLV